MIRTIDPQTPQSAVVFGRPIATLIATLIAVCVRRNHVAAIPPTWQPYRTCGRHTARGSWVSSDLRSLLPRPHISVASTSDLCCLNLRSLLPQSHISVASTSDLLCLNLRSLLPQSQISFASISDLRCLDLPSLLPLSCLRSEVVDTAKICMKVSKPCKFGPAGKYIYPKTQCRITISTR
jgi:hypothetical protein